MNPITAKRRALVSFFLMVIMVLSLVLPSEVFAADDVGKLEEESPTEKEKETEETIIEPETSLERTAEETLTEIALEREAENLRENNMPMAVLQAGSYGSCDWEITDEGVLRIKAGQLPEGPHNPPWKAHVASIKSLVVEKGVIAGKNATGLFSGLSQVQDVDVSGLDTSQTESMTRMFHACRALEHIDISVLDTSHLKNMDRMFNNCSSLKSIDVSGINLSQVTRLDAVFENNSKLTEIKGLETWDTSQVTVMSNLFRRTALQDLKAIEGWNVTNLKDLNSTFYHCGIKSLDLSKWKPSKSLNLHYTFAESGLSELNLSGWNIKPTLLSYAFSFTSIEKLDLSQFEMQDLGQGYQSENIFIGMTNLRELSLGSQFFFHPDDNFRTTPPDNEIYTGKWQAVASGTVDHPMGESFTVEELRALYSDKQKPGPKETYVWAKREIPKGNLTIRKKVTNLNNTEDLEFRFKVTLSDPSISGNYGDLSFEKGIATFLLKDGESKTAMGLVAGVGFKVEEEAHDHFETLANGAEGIIQKDETSVADFENRRKDSHVYLAVHTLIEGVKGVAQQELLESLKAVLVDEELKESYPAYTISDNGHTLMFSHVPRGKNYTLKFITPEGYQFKAGVTDGNEVYLDSGALINVTDQPEYTLYTQLEQVNKGDLVITKKVTGTDSDKEKPFSFTLSLSDKNLQGKYGDLIFEKGTATFTLKDGESKTVRGLAAGLNYLVTEAPYSDYQVTATQDQGIIKTNEKLEVLFINHRDKKEDHQPPKQDPPKQENPKNPPKSSPEKVLPKTGSDHHAWLWIAGSMIFLLGLGLLHRGFKKKDHAKF